MPGRCCRRIPTVAARCSSPRRSVCVMFHPVLARAGDLAMAERIRAETESMRRGGEQIDREADLVSDSVDRLVEATERLGKPWGEGEIADAFAPGYLKN